MHLAPPSTAMIEYLKVKNTHLCWTMYYELLLHIVVCLVNLVMKLILWINNDNNNVIIIIINNKLIIIGKTALLGTARFLQRVLEYQGCRTWLVPGTGYQLNTESIHVYMISSSIDGSQENVLCLNYCSFSEETLRFICFCQLTVNEKVFCCFLQMVSTVDTMYYRGEHCLSVVFFDLLTC